MSTSFLKDIREQNLFSQKQVYDGLCSPATFSRIENMEKHPDFILLDALVGRLGLDSADLNPYPGETEYRLLESRLAILADLTAERYEDAKIKLADYEKGMPKSHLHRQFFLYQMFRVKWHEPESLFICEKLAPANSLFRLTSALDKSISDGGSSDKTPPCVFDFSEIFPCQNSATGTVMPALICEAEELLIEAWHQTKKTHEILENELYTPAEIYILLNLIHIGSRYWNMDRILFQLNTLYRKIEKLFSGNLLNELKSACMWELLCQGRYSWDIHTLLIKTDNALHSLSSQQSFRHAIRLHLFLAQVLARFLERPGDHAVERERLIRECRMLYFSFECLGQIWKRDQIAAYCLEKTGEDIRE